MVTRSLQKFSAKTPDTEGKDVALLINIGSILLDKSVFSSFAATQTLASMDTIARQVLPMRLFTISTKRWSVRMKDRGTKNLKVRI